jgi:serine/threonine protein kinase
MSGKTDGTELEGLFGSIAVKQRYISPFQLEVAEVRQRLLKAQGVTQRLGAILVDDDVLTHEQVRRILAIQEKTVLACPECEAQYNVEGIDPGNRFLCSRCGKVLKVPAGDVDVSHIEEGAPVKAASREVHTPKGMIGREMGGCCIEKLLGRGAMGAVYLAKQISLQRPVALKVLEPGVVSRPEHVTRFEREARAAARLDHPAIVRIYSMGRAEDLDTYFIVMELVDGETLGERVAKGGRLEESEALRFIADAAAGLDEAHRSGIVHRDIKPDNIMVNRLGKAKVADFGLVRCAEESVNLTRSGATLGTPAYMAPEQGLGSDVGPQADIYSLGATLYRILAGCHPFKADTPIAMLMMHAKAPIPRIREVAPEVSRATENLLLRMMAKKPKSRPATAGDVVLEIEKILQGSPKRSRAKTAKKGRRRSRPRSDRAVRKVAGVSPALLWGAAGAALAVIVMIVAVLALSGSPEKKRAPKKRKPAKVERTPRPKKAPAPPGKSPREKAHAWLADVRARAREREGAGAYPDVILIWSNACDQAQKGRMGLSEDIFLEEITRVKQAWFEEAHRRMDQTLALTEEYLEAKVYDRALDSAKDCPASWMAVEGIEAKIHKLQYLRNRIFYLQEKQKENKNKVRNSRLDRLRREAAFGKKTQGFGTNDAFSVEWSADGEVNYDAGPKTVTLTVGGRATRSSILTCFRMQKEWENYTVTFSYKSSSALCFLYRIDCRATNLRQETVLPAKASWTRVVVVVQGVTCRTRVAEGEETEVMADLRKGHFGFLLAQKGSASLRELSFTVTR